MPLPSRKKTKTKINRLDRPSRYLDEIDSDELDEEERQLAESIRNGIIRPDKFHFDE